MDILHNISNVTLVRNWESLIERSIKKADEKIINKIELEQEEIIRSKKELGAHAWFVIDCYVLPNNFYAVSLEEGHVINYTILKYDEKQDRFISILESNLEEN